MISDELLRTAAGELGDCMLDCLPPEEDYRFSSRFQRKMRHLRFRADHPISHALTSCAAILLVLLTAFATLMVASPTVRAAVLGWFQSIDRGVTSYSFEGQLITQNRSEYCLSRIPEGYTLQKTEELPNGKAYIYHDNLGQSLNFTYLHGSDYDTVIWDTREHKHQTVSLEQGRADIYLPNNSEEDSIIVWYNSAENELFSISFHADVNELIALAESVKLK